MEGGNEKVGDIKRILMEAFKKRLKFFTFGGGVTTSLRYTFQKYGSNAPKKWGDQAECKK